MRGHHTCTPLHLFCSGLGRQHTKAPMAAAISSFMSPLMTDDVNDQIDHNTGNNVPYSYRIVCGFFNLPC